MMAGRLGENPRRHGPRRRPSGSSAAKRSALNRATATAAAHIAQGSSVTHKVHSSSRDVPSFAAAARIASISAWAVGIVRSAHRIARLGDDLVAERDDRADRHLAGRGRLGGELERSAHRRRQAGSSSPRG